ncbi:Asparagine synthase [Tsuneonella dongtanensis]|uniref:Asparagine synthase n=1 Tax=Tsuneonella dongtanensis TaxID=692370 RepID=A0A1B2AB99_9SPHN|nr:asparagine synthase-related protein [Tsuneonella dongtanensis]ANY19412.1 Asparagine synthase [Tsuneonella dongtanensis]
MPAEAGPEQSHDLLVAAAIDLCGGTRADACGERMAAALLLGRAGDVRSGPIEGGWFAARSLHAPAGSRSPRVIRTQWSASSDGALTMLAGTIHHFSDTCRTLAIDPRGGPALAYAAAHAQFGDDCDRVLTGNYTALQWFPSRRQVRIARSPTGFYPMHVWRDGEFLVAASIPRALFAAGAPDEIDEAMLGDRLLFNSTDHVRSWFLGHRRVGAATVEMHDPAGFQRRTFWSFDAVRPVRFARDEDYVEAVDEQMGRALDAALEGTRRCAMYLSGGLDSQGVASYAVERLAGGERLHAYTALPMVEAPHRAPPDRFDDESAHVRALADMYPDRIETNFVRSEDQNLGDEMEAVFLMGSWPPANVATGAWSYPIVRAAAAAGCDTILNAGFGNMVFSYDGYTGFPGWLRQGRIVTLLRELRALDDDRSLAWRFAARAVMPNLPPAARLAIKGRAKTSVDPFTTWSPMREDFARDSGAIDRFREAGLEAATSRTASGAEWRQGAWESGFTDGPELQVAFALLYGVQDRDPTAYLPLVELCAGMPDDQFLRHGQSRWLARRLLKGRIPEMVRLETRRGRQNADWPERFARERDALRAELAMLENDPDVARVIDLPRLAGDLSAWAGPSADTLADKNRIQTAIGTGITAARFLRYSRRRNVA